MKLFKYFMASAAMIAALAGCQKENPGEDGPTSGYLTVKATVDGAVISQWESGDVLKVVCEDEMYEFKTAESSATATFTQEEEELKANMIGENGVSAFANCRTMYGAFNISPEQTWKDGASSVAIPSYAYTLNAPEKNVLSMDFNALASVIELTFTPYAMTVESLKLEAAENATISAGALAGAFKVNAAEGTVAATTENNEIVITFDGGLNVAQGATIKIPVGWCNIAGGLKATVVYEGTKEYITTILQSDNVVKTYDDASGFKKGKVIASTFEFDPNAFPRTWYVSATGSADALGVKESEPTTLSAALKDALAGSVIKLAAGTYKPDTTYPEMEGDAYKTFLVKRNVTLEGADGAVIDGNATSVHAMVVCSPKIAGEKVVIKNITVKNGKNEGAEGVLNMTLVKGETEAEDVVLSSDLGAAIAVVNSTVEMEDVVLTENNAVKAPGMYATGSEVTLKDCTISKNAASANCGGAMFDSNCVVVMDGCVVTENVAETTGGALYFRATAAGGLELDMKNCEISKNEAKTNNGGSLYIADESGEGKLKFNIDGCTIKENKSGNMGYVVMVSVSGTVKNCLIENNYAAKNGGWYHYTDLNNVAETSVVFENCTFKGNYANLGPGIYAYNQAGKYNIYAINCLFDGQTAPGRGAYYVRNNAVAEYNAYAVNCTFSGNNAGSNGTAINTYGAASKPATMNVIGCTVVNNTNSKADCYAVYAETVEASVKVYNSIVSGNPNSGSTADLDAAAAAGKGTIAYYNSIIGAQYYADNATAEVKPAWDYSTMIGALGTDGTCKLVGNAASNPAFGNGMTVAALSALANSAVPASILTTDQLGNARTDADKVIGACVK